MRLQVLAQAAEQPGVLGEALHEDLARSIEHCLDVGEAGLGVEESFRFGFRRQPRIAEEGFGERLQSGLAGDLGLGAALLLVGQVEILETLLGLGQRDVGFELGGQLALLADRSEDRGAARLELAQVNQALVERAQLGVVETAGDLLAVTGDEGDGCSLGEQFDGGDHLLQAAAEFLGDLPGDAVFGVVLGTILGGGGQLRHRCAGVRVKKGGRTMQNRARKLKFAQVRRHSPSRRALRPDQPFADGQAWSQARKPSASIGRAYR